ncbi:MAG: hypothetical protein ACXV4C_10010 [Halobacteriota archaeon]
MTAETDLHAIRQLIEKGVETQERQAAALEAILDHLREGRARVSTR